MTLHCWVGRLSQSTYGAAVFSQQWRLQCLEVGEIPPLGFTNKALRGHATDPPSSGQRTSLTRRHVSYLTSVEGVGCMSRIPGTCKRKRGASR